ncbi:MAG: Zn-ribbon domain-containing OB-fold protein [Dehalococcoidia bacterium]
MAEYTKPIPVADERSQPWFDAAREHRLLLQRCTNCGTHRFPAWPRCDECWSTEWEWAQSSGKGTVFTWGRMHQVYQEGFKDEVPYTIAIVELDEGPWMNTNLVNVEPHAVKAGLRVEVVFDDITDEISLPKFQPLRE